MIIIIIVIFIITILFVWESVFNSRSPKFDLRFLVYGRLANQIQKYLITQMSKSLKWPMLHFSFLMLFFWGGRGGGGCLLNLYLFILFFFFCLFYARLIKEEVNTLIGANITF